MKKTVITLVMIMVFAIGGVVWVMGDVKEQAEKVSVEEVTYFGEPSAVDGLTFQFEDCIGNNRLVYEVNYQEGSADSKLKKIGSSYSGQEEGKVPKINITNSNAYAILDPSHFSEDETTGKNDGMKEIYEMIQIHEAKNGPHVIYAKLADYCDYYPISMMISIPDKISMQKNGNILSTDFLSQRENSTGAAAYNAEKINQFFRIPVEEEQEVDITYYKMDNHRYLFEETIHPTSDSYCLDEALNVGAITDEAIFFFLNNRKGDGSLVDTSLIPGGYGIYKLPYRYITKLNYHGEILFRGYDIVADELETFYPLDEQWLVRGIDVSQDQSRLYVCVEEDGQLILKIISTKTGLRIDQVALGDLQKYDLVEIDEVDGRLIILKGREQFLIIGEKEDTYSMERKIDLSSINLPSGYTMRSILTGKEGIAYDGERLAVISANLPDEAGNSNTGFTVLVLGEEGLRYLGELVNEFDNVNQYINKYYMADMELIYRYRIRRGQDDKKIAFE